MENLKHLKPILKTSQQRDDQLFDSFDGILGIETTLFPQSLIVSYQTHRSLIRSGENLNSTVFWNGKYIYLFLLLLLMKPHIAPTVSNNKNYNNLTIVMVTYSHQLLETSTSTWTDPFVEQAQ